jgi:hypothetical protein
VARFGIIKSLPFSVLRNRTHQGSLRRCIARPEISERPRHFGVCEGNPLDQKFGKQRDKLGFRGNVLDCFERQVRNESSDQLWRIEKYGSTDQSESLANTHRKGVTVPALGDIGSQVDVVFLTELKS